MYRSDDPIRDFERYDAEQEAELEKRPVCEYCGEHIQGERALYINGEFLCTDCIGEHMIDVEDYME